MTPERLRLRAVAGLGLVLAALSVLLVRLAWLQLVDCPQMRRAAHAQHYTRIEVVTAQRGRILDRNGAILAQTERFPSLAADPKMVTDPAQFAAAVEQETGIAAADVRTALARGGRFQWLRRQIADRAGVERLRRHLRDLKMEGLVVVEEPKRVYPLGAFAAHVLGFTDRDGVGLEGVESLKQKELAGRNGRRIALRDAAGTPIASASEAFDPPTDGEDVRLTIDASIQSFAEEAANRSWTESGALGVAVGIVDVRTGELLAVACRPAFDPNDASRTVADERRNRFFTDAFEPGSVFKPIVMAAALDAGTVTPDTRIDTHGGRFQVGKRVIHEDKGHEYGVLLPREAIARSSNCAMAAIGLQMGEGLLKPALQRFGFGGRTSIRWPGEQAGDIQAKTRWRDSDQLVSAAFGHAMTATPAQILHAYATLAGGGERREFRLFADAPCTEPVRILSERAAADVVPMMEAVLTDPKGTAFAVRKQCPEFRVAGKTGTAQKLQTGGHVSSFACFGPCEEPRLAVLVLVDEPKKATYGSVVAAPYALRALRDSLHFLTVEPTSGTAARQAPPAGPAAKVAVNSGSLSNAEVAPR